jgi:hypothetical protein
VNGEVEDPRLACLEGACRVWAIGAVRGEASQLARLDDLVGE